MVEEIIWIIPAAPRDAVGDPELDPDTGEPLPSGTPWSWSSCVVWPRHSTQDAEGGYRLINGQNVWIKGVPRDGEGAVQLPYPGDTVVIRQTEYQVEDNGVGYYPEKGIKLVTRRIGVDRTVVTL